MSDTMSREDRLLEAMLQGHITHHGNLPSRDVFRRLAKCAEGMERALDERDLKRAEARRDEMLERKAKRRRDGEPGGVTAKIAAAGLK